jgi:uncharacterized membrane protein
VAALSYLLLPVTGLLALGFGSETRTRFHGLQSIVFGLVWALALYAASAVSASATKLVFGVGALSWLLLFGATLAGRDPKLPGIGAVLAKAAADDLRDQTG